MNKFYPLFSVLLLLFALGSSPIQAQDVHFSQFNNSPLQLSPAMTGVYDGSFRFVANYRSQWSSIFGKQAYTTYAASFEGKIYAVKDDYFGFGLTVLSDRAGESQFSQTKANLSFSYLKQISGGGRSYKKQAQFLVAGAQVGIGQHGINWEALKFSLQFDGDAYNPSLATGEDVGQNSFIYMDVNAGLMWYGVFDERKSMYFGLTAHHINAPNVTFYDDSSEPLYMKLSVHGGGELLMGKYLSIMPGVVAMIQGPSLQVMAGATLRYANNDWGDVAFRIGAHGRIVGQFDNKFGTDAASISAGVEFHRFMVVGSYDVNTSTLIPATNNRGAFELSLIYTNPPQGKRGNVNCPKF